MEFCDRCGKMLSVQTDGEGMVGVCTCGFAKELEKTFSFSEKSVFIEKGEGVFENEEEKEGFPHLCGKCGNGEAEVFDLGASYSDESNIYLFKCKKCGHVERQAEGSGNK